MATIQEQLKQFNEIVKRRGALPAPKPAPAPKPKTPQQEFLGAVSGYEPKAGKPSYTQQRQRTKGTLENDMVQVDSELGNNPKLRGIIRKVLYNARATGDYNESQLSEIRSNAVKMARSGKTANLEAFVKETDKIVSDKLKAFEDRAVKREDLRAEQRYLQGGGGQKEDIYADLKRNDAVRAAGALSPFFFSPENLSTAAAMTKPGEGEADLAGRMLAQGLQEIASNVRRPITRDVRSAVELPTGASELEQLLNFAAPYAIPGAGGIGGALARGLVTDLPSIAYGVKDAGGPSGFVQQMAGAGAGISDPRLSGQEQFASLLAGLGSVLQVAGAPALAHHAYQGVKGMRQPVPREPFFTPKADPGYVSDAPLDLVGMQERRQRALPGRSPESVIESGLQGFEAQTQKALPAPEKQKALPQPAQNPKPAKFEPKADPNYQAGDVPDIRKGLKPVQEPAATQKEPWQMTRDEYASSVTTRTDNVRETPFREWAESKGLRSGRDYASDVQFAEYIGRSAFPTSNTTTKAQMGKTAGLKKLVDARNRLLEAWENEVPVAKRERALSNSESDAAHVRTMHKRAIRKALAEGKPVPAEVLADYPDLAPKPAKFEPKADPNYQAGDVPDIRKGLKPAQKPAATQKEPALQPKPEAEAPRMVANRMESRPPVFDDVVVVSSPDGKLQRVANVRGSDPDGYTLWDGTNQFRVSKSQVRLATTNEKALPIGSRLKDEVAATLNVERPTPPALPVIDFPKKWRGKDGRIDAAALTGTQIDNYLTRKNRDNADSHYQWWRVRADDANQLNRVRTKSDPGWHYKVVQKALSEGKPVPAEVLADYPDLAPKPQPKPADVSQPVKAGTEEPKMVAEKTDARKQRADELIKLASEGKRGEVSRRVTPTDPLVFEAEQRIAGASGGSFVRPLIEPRSEYRKPWEDYVLQEVSTGKLTASEADAIFQSLSGDGRNTPMLSHYTEYLYQLEDQYRRKSANQSPKPQRTAQNPKPAKFEPKSDPNYQTGDVPDIRKGLKSVQKPAATQKEPWKYTAQEWDDSVRRYPFEENRRQYESEFAGIANWMKREGIDITGFASAEDFINGALTSDRQWAKGRATGLTPRQRLTVKGRFGNTERAETLRKGLLKLLELKEQKGVRLPTTEETARSRDFHKRSVERALSEGKPVPAEVLADYPDLAPKPQPKPADGAQPAKAGTEAAANRIAPEKSPDPVIRDAHRVPSNGKDLPAEWAKEKVSSQTGLRPSQAKYLGERLNEGSDKLPIETPHNLWPTEQESKLQNGLAGEKARYKEIAAKYAENRRNTRKQVIKVPGDGEWTVYSQSQASELLKAIGLNKEKTVRKPAWIKNSQPVYFEGWSGTGHMMFKGDPKIEGAKSPISPETFQKLIPNEITSAAKSVEHLADSDGKFSDELRVTFEDGTSVRVFKQYLDEGIKRHLQIVRGSSDDVIAFASDSGEIIGILAVRKSKWEPSGSVPYKKFKPAAPTKSQSVQKIKDGLKKFTDIDPDGPHKTGAGWVPFTEGQIEGLKMVAEGAWELAKISGKSAMDHAFQTMKSHWNPTMQKWFEDEFKRRTTVKPERAANKPTEAVEAPTKKDAVPTPAKEAKAPPTNQKVPPAQVTGVSNRQFAAEEALGGPKTETGKGAKRGSIVEIGKKAVQEGRINPDALADDIANNRRAAATDEEAGALIYGNALKTAEVDRSRKALDAAIENGTGIEAARAAYNAAQDHLTDYRQKVQASKTKQSDLFRALGDSTDYQGNYSEFKAEVARQRGVKASELSDDLPELKQAKAKIDELNSLISKHEAKIKELEAQKAQDRQGNRPRGRSRDINTIRKEKAKALEDYNRIMDAVISGQSVMGSGLGSLGGFVHYPKAMRALRKVMELSLEEAKVVKMDSKAYDAVRESLKDVEIKDPVTGDKIDVTDDFINGIVSKLYEETESHTISDAQARLNELRKQAALLSKIADAKTGVVTVGKAIPPPTASLKTLRAELKTLLKSIGQTGASKATITRLNNILADVEGQLKGQYRHIRNNKKSQVGRPIREKINEVRKTMRLEDTIADLEEQIRTGEIKAPSRRTVMLTAEQAKMAGRIRGLREQIDGIREAMKPQGWGERFASSVAGLALSNPVSRVVDVTANTAKVISYAVQNPLRVAIGSVLDKIVFNGTSGVYQEKALSIKKLRQVMEGARSRWGEEAVQTMRGHDIATAQKYGRGNVVTNFTGLSDVPFKDTYSRLALHDMAEGMARRELGTKAPASALDARTLELFNNPTDEMLLVAHDWALRQTYNSDNAVSKIVSGSKRSFIDAANRQFGENGRQLAIALSAIAEAPVRFSKVIGNVALERANYTTGLLEATARTIMAKGHYTPQQARLITDLAAKGLTGIALVYAGKFFSQNGLYEPEVIKTENGFVYVDHPWLGGKMMEQVGGLFAPFLWGASLDAISKSDITEKQKASATYRLASDLAFNQPLMSGTENILRAADSSKSAGEVAGTMVASLIPGFMKQWAKTQDYLKSDKAQGDPHTGRPVKRETFGDNLKQHVPFLRETLPTAVRKNVSQKKASSVAISSGTSEKTKPKKQEPAYIPY